TQVLDPVTHRTRRRPGHRNAPVRKGRRPQIPPALADRGPREAGLGVRTERTSRYLRLGPAPASRNRVRVIDPTTYVGGDPAAVVRFPRVRDERAKPVRPGGRTER